MNFRILVVFSISLLGLSCSLYQSDARKALEADGIALSQASSKLTPAELNQLSAEFCANVNEDFSAVYDRRPQRLETVTTGDLSWFEWANERDQQTDLQFTHLDIRTQSIKRCLFSLDRAWTNDDFRWAEAIAWNFVHGQEKTQ